MLYLRKQAKQKQKKKQKQNMNTEIIYKLFDHDKTYCALILKIPFKRVLSWPGGQPQCICS